MLFVLRVLLHKAGLLLLLLSHLPSQITLLWPAKEVTRPWEPASFGQSQAPAGAAGPGQPLPPHRRQSSCCPQWHKAWALPKTIPLPTRSTLPSGSDTSWPRAAGFDQLLSGVAAPHVPLSSMDKNGQRCSTENLQPRQLQLSPHQVNATNSQKCSHFSSLLLFSWF